MGDNYSFLQEKIKDEAGSPKTVKKKVVRIIILGFIFGIIACFTFIAFHPVVSGLLGQNKEEITIPEDEETTSEEVQQSNVDAEERAKEQRQMRLLKELQNEVKSNTSAIVYISGQRKIEKNTEVKKTSGVILADNGSEILVLSQTLSEKELKNIRITFADGKDYAAEVKMKDDNLGIVICAVEKETLKKETLKQMAIVKLGNSLLSESGDPVFVIGKSGAKSMQISYGFVASSEEKMEIADGQVELLRVDVAGASFDNGVLFDQNGEMIGLVKKSLSDNKTLVTVLSISDIKNELERMLNGKGVPYTGVYGITLPEELEKEGLTEGICVKEIDTDSPAMEAGIQQGDVITDLNGTKISSMNEYRNALLKMKVKNQLTLKGYRKGADDNYVEMEFKLIVGKK